MLQHVTAHHLTRLACLYVRQSTLQQVFEHTESTSRQYALRERALALGWAEERIVVIDQGEIVWGELQHHDVLRVLQQPAYAGAYAFGRTRTTKSANGRVHIQELPRSQWDTLVKNAHMGYITWEEFERNEAQLVMNSQAYAPERFSPPREEPALLQGLIICGKCGERMTVRYHQREGQRIPVPRWIELLEPFS